MSDSYFPRWPVRPDAGEGASSRPTSASPGRR